MFSHMIFFATIFPHVFFSKIIFVEFYFNIELIENSALTFPTCFFPIFSHLFFFQNCLLLLFSIFLCFFFQNCFCWFFFSYGADWKFSFVVFFFKILWIATIFLHMVFFSFFNDFFFRIVFVNFIFFHIELIENLAS